MVVCGSGVEQQFSELSFGFFRRQLVDYRLKPFPVAPATASLGDAGAKIRPHRNCQILIFQADDFSWKLQRFELSKQEHNLLDSAQNDILAEFEAIVIVTGIGTEVFPAKERSFLAQFAELVELALESA